VRIAVLAVASALVACGCARASAVVASPAKVSGRIEGMLRVPEGAHVQVLRIDGDGVLTPDPFERFVPDSLGRFTTGVLSPGRYTLVYRRPDAPPSSTTVRVPDQSHVVLRAVRDDIGVALSVKTSEPEPVRCVLTEASPPAGVADVREFECRHRLAATVRGLRPGRYYLDLPERGLTTEVDVPAGSAQRDLTLDPPSTSGLGGVSGSVRRKNGTGAPWLVVAARPLAEGAGPAERWGRYVTTDRTGTFSLGAIPPGKTLVRVERRQGSLPVLPAPRTVAIPPSGMIEVGFVVGP
jgi:hypothetical protein